MRRLLSNLAWLHAAWLCELAVRLNSPLVRRVLEADGMELRPAIVRDEYARHLTESEARWVIAWSQIALSKPAVRA